MRRQATVRNQKRWLAYCERELAKADLSDARRSVLEGKRAFLAKQLEGKSFCTLCGTEITHPDSIAAGVGSRCRHKAGVS